MSFTLVKEFNATFEVKTRTSPAVRVSEAKLRFGLIEEELKELRDAYKACDIVELADAFGDIEYVTIGAAQVFGIEEQVVERFRQSVGVLDSGDLDFDAESLFTEEEQTEILDELRDNILRNDVDETVATLGTLLAFNRAAAEEFGIDLDAVVKAIHKSNMTKLGEDGKPIFRESDRKVLKGPDYVTPTADIEAELFGANDAESV